MVRFLPFRATILSRKTPDIHLEDDLYCNYLLKFWNRMARLRLLLSFCWHSFIFVNCHIYSCLIGIYFEVHIMQKGKVLNATVQINNIY
jgi:hypothetical protein